MRRWGWTAILIGAMAASPSWSAPKSSGEVRVSFVTLEIRHRVFHDFTDRQQVKLNQEFPVGDTDYTARIVQYVPDFAMDMKTRKVLSRSNEPKNPAFKIIVKQKKAPQDTTWAMINMVPHYARKSMLAFHVVRIDFIGHAPILRPDSTSQMPKPAPSAQPIQKAEKTTR
jgi:hypothetical protein